MKMHGTTTNYQGLYTYSLYVDIFMIITGDADGDVNGELPSYY